MSSPPRTTSHTRARLPMGESPRAFGSFSLSPPDAPTNTLREAGTFLGAQLFIDDTLPENWFRVVHKDGSVSWGWFSR
jgi:hypothetical protein